MTTKNAQDSARNARTTQHTPGQWRIGDAGMTVFGPPNGTPAPEVIAPCRTRANARLIAAAPDLLDALQRMVDRFVECSLGETQHSILACAGCNARAAIRRATQQGG